MHELYPMRFKEILRNYGFGNRWIPAAFAKTDLPDDHRIAETWEVCDRPGESSVLLNGRFAGSTLHDLIGRFGGALLGDTIMAHFGGRFPLLIKFLDCSNPLGAQIHHSDELARKHGLDDTGKTEAWYMLDTREGAGIHVGAAPGLTHDAFRRALESGTVVDTMVHHPVAAGDAYLLYAGTMHYSAGGVLFYEIMQNSDVVMGLGSLHGDVPDRESRIDAAVEAVLLEDDADYRTTPLPLRAEGCRRHVILACRYFALERYDAVTGVELNDRGDRFSVLSQIAGWSTLMHETGEYRLAAGQSCVIPAACGSVKAIGGDGGSFLRAYVPDLNRDIVAPFREQGFSDNDIAALGGVSAANDIARLTKTQS